MTRKLLLLLVALVAASAAPVLGRDEPVLHVQEDILEQADSLSAELQAEEGELFSDSWEDWVPDAGIFAHPDAQRDLVTRLPGSAKIARRRMFSGYIPVEGKGRELFYWLLESDKGFRNAPVILWTNGGPGCSGFLGLLTEQGPFRPQRNGRLEENKYAWTKLASMVFIEQPVGVGFSRTTVRGEVYNDANAAKDNYRFIVNFFNRFPELRTNEFYISSESYGGHYMPTLAREIVDRGGVNNFKGFLVGNPLTSGLLRDVGEFMTFYGHQLISEPLYQMYSKANCQQNPYTLDCMKYAAEARRIVSGLDPYALDFPICTIRDEKEAFLRKLGLLATTVGDSAEPVVDEEEPAHVMLDHQTEPQVVQSRRRLEYFPPNYKPCQENYATKWLNRLDVRKALHVRGGAIWSGCNNFINMVYNRTDVEASMIPYYEYLSKKPIKIWIFSGDNDSICPTWSEQQWIWSFDTTSKWRAWYVAGQTAGYQINFKGFTFLTVHGAGHMVPSVRLTEIFT